MDKKTVKYGMIGVTAAVSIIDVWLWADDKDGNTISQIMRKAPNTIIFSLGYLAGHWFADGGDY